MKLLEKKVAIITGGSRGIGKGIAEIFVENGCSVAITYNSSKAEAEKLVNKLENKECNVKAYQSNAADFNEAQNLINDVLNDFGNIDILVNNAGITKDNLLMRMGEEDFDQVLEVNLKSVFNLTKAIQRPFLKQRKGSLIHMSSVVGVKGNAGQANYAASKAGLIGMSKSMALEYGKKNIKINCISPGFIKSEMTDKISENFKKILQDKISLERFGDPNDVANAVLFLSSGLSDYITGETIHVNGGMYFS